jgi:undecaprenyl diphosphate synthase
MNNSLSEQNPMRVPSHLAIIMDGNGRWAEQRHLPRILGHRKGVEVVQSVVDECLAQGMSYLTLFAFSSENWGRPQDEVEALMGLLGRFLKKELPSLQKRNIRLNAIGEINRLPQKIREILDDIIEDTSGNDALVLTLALSYGARNELVRVAQSLAEKAISGKIAPRDIGETDVAAALDTSGLPDPDLLIRTSGEMRISNFLLWQLAYAELYFTDVLWPDFNAEHLREAIAEYGRRHRRFGLTAAQLQNVDRY